MPVRRIDLSISGQWLDDEELHDLVFIALDQLAWVEQVVIESISTYGPDED